MLAYYKIYIFLMLISDFYLFIVALINKMILSIANVLFLARFCIFLTSTHKEFDIIIIFNFIFTLVLQMFKMWLTNLTFILKLLVFAKTYKLYNNRYLP